MELSTVQFNMSNRCCVVQLVCNFSACARRQGGGGGGLEMTDESSIAFLHRLLITHQPICDLAGFILTFLRAQRLHSNRILIPSMSKPPWQMWLCIGAGAVALLGYKLLAARQPAKLKTRIVDTASELHALCQDIVLQLNALSSEELVVADLDTEWAKKEEVVLLQIAVFDCVLLIRPRPIRSSSPETFDERHQLKQLLAHPKLIVSARGLARTFPSFESSAV